MENAAMSWLAQFASHSLAEKGTCPVLEAGSDPVHTLIAPWPGHWHTLHALDLQRKSANFSISIVKEGDTALLQPFLPRPVPFPTHSAGPAVSREVMQHLVLEGQTPRDQLGPSTAPKASSFQNLDTGLARLLPELIPLSFLRKG